MSLSGDHHETSGSPPMGPPGTKAEAGKDVATRDLSQQTLGNTVWTAGSTVVTAVLSAGSTIIVVRALHATAFGRYAYLLYALTLALGLSEVGVNKRGLNVLVRAWPAGDLTTVAAELRRLLQFAAFRAAAVAAVAVVLLHRSPALAAVVAVCVAIQSGSAPFSIAMVAQRRFRALSLTSTGVAILQAVSTSWVAIATRSAGWTAAAFFASQMLSVGVVVCLAPWSVLRGDVGRRRDLGARTQTAFYVYGICTLIIFGRSETVVLNATHQAVALGLFAIATTLAARATLLTDALYGSLLPAIGEVANRDSEGAGTAYSTSLRFSSFLVLATGVLVGPVFTIVGPVVLSSHSGSVRIAVAITLGGSLLQTFVDPLLSISQVELQHRSIALPAVAGAACDIGLAIALVPHFGLLGAALASLVGAAVFTFTLVVAIRLPPEAARTLRQQLTRVVAMVLALLAGGFATSRLPLGLAMAGDLLLSISVYILCGRGCGVLLDSDLEKIGPLVARTPLGRMQRGRRIARSLLLVARCPA